MSITVRRRTEFDEVHHDESLITALTGVRVKVRAERGAPCGEGG
jgi:hypothetical protein